MKLQVKFGHTCEDGDDASGLSGFQNFSKTCLSTKSEVDDNVDLTSYLIKVRRT